MSDIGVGSLVECIDANPNEAGGKRTPLVQGRIYTVRQMVPSGTMAWCGRANGTTYQKPVSGDSVRLVEIPSRPSGTDYPYGLFRFRPVRDDSLDVFRKLAEPTNERVTA